ncbi:fimbrial protein BcfE [Superficieibacter sp. HKU1]|uniref:fimbrial protein BcfE n=1 Tax=Superficieibacter sp. HKU1 TaxID=3031919 RepID=UPI0023E31925|nr:fimbrial protein BcfE [Superficieibacter sp. HKU1]WES69224.1 fimbrial protein BcfE [Superficieibacter sp. HKU1]
MNTLKWLPASMLFILLSGTAARADDNSYNLEFTGTIQAATCNVDLSSLSQSIDLGQFPIDSFPSVGTTTKFKPFNINLRNCSRGISGTKVWFTGEADSNNPALLALTDTGMGNETMMATGVGVEILDENQDPVSINNTDSVVYPLKAGRNTLSFYIRYKSTLPQVTSGNATAVMYFDLEYQ